VLAEEGDQQLEDVENVLVLREAGNCLKNALFQNVDLLKQLNTVSGNSDHIRTKTRIFLACIGSFSLIVFCPHPTFSMTPLMQSVIAQVNA